MPDGGAHGGLGSAVLIREGVELVPTLTATEAGLGQRQGPRLTAQGRDPRFRGDQR
jgi:hypothetical protein